MTSIRVAMYSYDSRLNSTRTWRYQKTSIPSNMGCTPARANISSDTEIASDPVADDGAANFGKLIGGYKVNGNPVPNQSAHWFGGLPLGGNILFLDGHVGSRGFKLGSIPGPGADPNNNRIMHERCYPQKYNQHPLLFLIAPCNDLVARLR